LVRLLLLFNTVVTPHGSFDELNLETKLTGLAYAAGQHCYGRVF
jgi:hypothetical protein